MRRKRINFRNTAHRCGKRRSDRTSRTYYITVVVRFLNESVRDIVHDRVTVTDNGFKLTVEPCLNDFVEDSVVTVQFVCLCIGDVSDIGSGSCDLRRIRSVRERLDAELDHVSDLVGIVNYNFFCLLFSQI